MRMCGTPLYSSTYCCNMHYLAPVCIREKTSILRTMKRPKRNCPCLPDLPIAVVRTDMHVLNKTNKCMTVRYIYICIHTYIYISLYILYVRTKKCAYVCMYVCRYVYIYIYMYTYYKV